MQNMFIVLLPFSCSFDIFVNFAIILFFSSVESRGMKGALRAVHFLIHSFLFILHFLITKFQLKSSLQYLIVLSCLLWCLLVKYWVHSGIRTTIEKNTYKCLSSRIRQVATDNRRAKESARFFQAPKIQPLRQPPLQSPSQPGAEARMESQSVSAGAEPNCPFPNTLWPVSRQRRFTNTSESKQSHNTM